MLILNHPALWPYYQGPSVDPGPDPDSPLRLLADWYGQDQGPVPVVELPARAPMPAMNSRRYVPSCRVHLRSWRR